ncbi:hypothetical protein V6N13_012241 [Hibiscus sabdariffa]|uniref:RNase H type-1 domain-containing protein n=1 Tax=Hibiscus sabdariffa TaxID=183260 RepID=A0ABR2SFE4_9ROSI
MGAERLQTQYDCKHAIDLVATVYVVRPLPLVQAIASLRSCAWCIVVSWVPRECNMVADSLSRLPTSQSFELMILDEVPQSIVPLLDRDINGPPYSRLV